MRAPRRVSRELFSPPKPCREQAFRATWPEISQRGNKAGRDWLGEAHIARGRFANERHADSDGDLPQKFLAKKPPLAKLDLAGVIHQPTRKGADQRSERPAKDA